MKISELGPQEMSDTILEIGAKFFPRRYRRFKDLRPFSEAREWAQTLDWRQNPYDRFLLRREILHHLESKSGHRAWENVFSFASREEIGGEVDRLMDEFPEEFERSGVFCYVLVTLPWLLRFRHDRVRYNRLAAVFGRLPSADESNKKGSFELE
jgi:hypothetical protein